jgi:hypothetical protein
MAVMTPSEVEGLMLALAFSLERPTFTVRELGLAIFGNEYTLTSCEIYGRKLLDDLAKAGAVAHRHYGGWWITEKGRIAAALLMARDPTLRVAFIDP